MHALGALLGAAPQPGEPAPGEPPDPGHRAVWLSLDPRSGEASVYPGDVCERLEAAFLRGGEREVPLTGLGGLFQNYSVDLGTAEEQPSQRNVNARGSRDVRRLVVPEGAAEVVLHVIQERGWRVADFSAEGLTQERRVPLSAAAGRHDGGAPPLGSTGSDRNLDEAEGGQERKAKAASDAARGLVGLWEWSGLTHVGDAGQVPEEMWGVYSKEQNEYIEAAYASGQSTATVSIGIRSYEITFRGLNGARQIDKSHRKRRVVRRRAVTMQERDDALTSVGQVTNSQMNEEECAICVLPFAETPSVPIVTLPPCGHHFHAACVQQIADQRGHCPLCRADVDWSAAMSRMDMGRKHS